MEMTTIVEYPAIRENKISLTEANLVRASRKGDLEAFNQLVILYQDRIFALALRIVGDEDSAEDITQNTFLAAYRSLPGFRDGSFRSWLYRIGTNVCYDELRRRKRHPVLPLEDGDEPEEGAAPLYDLPGSRTLPEQECERHELEQVIQQALNRLDTGQRAVVVLVDLEGFDYTEAGQILNVPVGTVKSRLARARLRLSQLLGTFGPPADAHPTWRAN